MADRYEEYKKEYRRLLDQNMDPSYAILAANLRMSKETISKHKKRMFEECPELACVGTLAPSRNLEKAFNKAVEEGMQEREKAFKQVIARQRTDEQDLLEESAQRRCDLEQAQAEVAQLKEKVTRLEAQCAAARESQQRSELQLRESQRELDRCQDKLKQVPTLEQQAARAADLEKEVTRLQAKLDSEVEHRKAWIVETREFMTKMEAERQVLRLENIQLKMNLGNGRFKPAVLQSNGTTGQGTGTGAQSGNTADPVQ